MKLYEVTYTHNDRYDGSKCDWDLNVVAADVAAAEQKVRAYAREVWGHEGIAVTRVRVIASIDVP